MRGWDCKCKILRMLIKKHLLKMAMFRRIILFLHGICITPLNNITT